MIQSKTDSGQKKIWFYSLRSKLIVMAVAVVFFPMLLTTLSAIISQKAQIEHSLKRELNASLSSCQLYYHGEEEKLKIVNLTVASDNTCKTTLRLGVLPQLQQQIETMGKKYLLDFLVVTDSSGKVVASYPPTEKEDVDLSRHPFIALGLQGGSKTVTHREKYSLLADPMTFGEALSQSQVVLVMESVMPVMVRNEPIGTVLAGLKLSGNNEMMKRMVLASGADKTMLVRDKTLIAASFPSSECRGGEPLLQLSSVESGGHSADNELKIITCGKNQQRSVVKFYPIKDIFDEDLAVIVTLLNYDRSAGLLREAVQRILIIFLVGMLLAAVITFFVARSISRPVKKLSWAMEKMESGALDQVVEVDQNDEIGSLARGFNKMTSRLQLHLDTLEKEISDRMEAEKALFAEKERLAVTLRSIGDAVITTDVDGKIVFVNKIGEELTGWYNKDAQGLTLGTVFPLINEKTGRRYPDIFQTLLDGRHINDPEDSIVLIAKNGTQRNIASSGAPIRDRSGEIVGLVIVFRDISHEKLVERELLKVRKLESIGVLAGGIAHDFNNILSAILGNIELASMRVGKNDEKTGALLFGAQKATMRATALTKQLLTFSKGGTPVKDSTELPELIRDSAEFVLHGSQVTCKYSFPEDLWMVEADSGQLSQVIQNIILNAKDALPQGGQVSIQAQNINAGESTFPGAKASQYVRIAIEDSGIGISQELVDKIFDPYFTTKEKGSGLGLAICHSIIRKHGGYLTVESQHGNGTRFLIYLPAVSRSGKTVDVIRDAGEIQGTVRILVMDDEEIIRELVAMQLNTLGHEALLAADGEEAMRIYLDAEEKGTPVSAAIMDLTIPGGIGGKETAARLLQVCPDARLIVASGYSNDPVMANYRQYGFRVAVEKPFDLDTLRNAIAEALQQNP